MHRILNRMILGTAALTLFCLPPPTASAADPTDIVSVEAAVVSTAVFTETFDVVGTLSAKRRADIKSEYAGIIREIFVSEWVSVKRGDRLAQLDVREPEAVSKRIGAAVEMARADQLQAKAALQRAEREYARVENLFSSGLATRQNLDDASTEREVIRAKVAAALAQLRSAEYELELARTRLSKTLISAPIDGVVAERGINIGDLVGEAGSNKILFKIVDNRLLDLKVTIPARFVGELKIGMPLTFTTASFPNRRFEGRITYINPSLNDADRSLKVIAEVPNDPVALRDGMFVESRITFRERGNVLQIPRSALLTWNFDTHTGEVYVINNGIAQRRSIETGTVREDRVEVVKGLVVGDEVVSGGGFNVSDGAAVKVKTVN